AENKLTLSLEKGSKSAMPSFLTLAAGGETPRLAKSMEGGHTLDLGKDGLVSNEPEFLTLTQKEKAMDKEVENDDLAKAILLALAKSSGKEVTKAGRMVMARDDIKKARGAAKDVEECMKALHSMHKASYLGKAAKKPKNDGDADDF